LQKQGANPRTPVLKSKNVEWIVDTFSLIGIVGIVFIIQKVNFGSVCIHFEKANPATDSFACFALHNFKCIVSG
jgi:hypothetical protein